MDIEQGTFTPSIFTTTGGMADESVVYHSRLAELIAIQIVIQLFEGKYGRPI